jgi:hypothetical protein
MKVVIPDTKPEDLRLQTHFPLLSVMQVSEWPIEENKNDKSASVEMDEQNAADTKFVWEV